MGLWGSKPIEIKDPNKRPPQPVRPLVLKWLKDDDDGVLEMRPLTDTEEYVIQPRFEGHPSHIIVSVVHISGDDIPLMTREQVRLALYCTGQRFFDLRLLVDLQPVPWHSLLFRVSENVFPVLLDKALIMGINDNWKSIVQTEIQTYCPGVSEKGATAVRDELPWKLYFLKSSGDDGKRASIIHCADHLIEDGRSVQLFFSEFLANLARVISGEITREPEVHKSLFHPGLSSQDRRSDSLSYYQTTKDIVKELYRSTYATDQPPQTVVVPLEQRHYAIEFITMDAIGTAAILAFSKKHGLTVTSTLAGVVLTAIKLAFEPNTQATPSYYTVVLGVDLRPYYKPLVAHDAPAATFTDLFGSHIDVRRDTYGVDGTDRSLLDVAKQFDADNSRHMIKESLHLERYTLPIKTLATKNNGRMGMLHYTNLGVLKLPSEVTKKFKVNAFHVASPTNLVGGTVLFNVQTVNDELNFTFTFIDEIVPRNMRQAFLDRFRDAVKKLQLEEQQKQPTSSKA
jgi:hypothetical protein